ncbi:hypothetical protein KQI82_12365 [Oscillibacter sp. MSJ-2]|uniref:Uncharacterized protein n=1 Tax=Dysosmobacter acutus TaxID=2841504 RepID=A0ABS6FCB2_9FIRM|nr:hypothetical protein [Dysosmobacter acutus]MBU5627703.1 hypothetical protein [Dysosmobacter acutus]
MTQLICGGVRLPQTSHDNYKCYPSQLGKQIEMISGRIVTEVRGTVQIIEYSYDKMPDEIYTALLAVLRSKQAFPVVYLPDDSDVMMSSQFICTAFPTPTFAFDVSGKAVWHNTAFTLREVAPHD